MFLKRGLADLMGPLALEEEDEERLAWAENCGSDGETAFPAEASKYGGLNLSQGVPLRTQDGDISFLLLLFLIFISIYLQRIFILYLL